MVTLRHKDVLAIIVAVIIILLFFSLLPFYLGIVIAWILNAFLDE
jgi:hypothetical protein